MDLQSHQEGQTEERLKPKHTRSMCGGWNKAVLLLGPACVCAAAGRAAQVLSSVFASPCLVWGSSKGLDEARKAEQVQFESICLK